jgi:hypothetical protein
VLNYTLLYEDLGGITSTLVGDEWLASSPCCFTPHWIVGWVGHRAGPRDMQEWKFLTLPGLELLPLGVLAHSQSLFRFSVKNNAIEINIQVLFIFIWCYYLHNNGCAGHLMLWCLVMSVSSHQLTLATEVVSPDTSQQPISVQTTRPGISLANVCKVNNVSGSWNRLSYRLDHKNPVKVGVTQNDTGSACYSGLCTRACSKRKLHFFVLVNKSSFKRINLKYH